MATNLIKFCVRRYYDVETEATQKDSSNNPYHQGTIYQVKYNPATIISNGRQGDLEQFIAHFRYWKWSGTKVVTLPLARQGLDPTQVTHNGAGMEPFDASLFHAFKLDNWAVQSVPWTETGTDTDQIFLMDQSWKKTSVFKPWSIFIKPRAYELNYSAPQFGQITSSGSAFNPDYLHATPVGDPYHPMETQHGVAGSGSAPAVASDIGAIVDQNRIMTMTPHTADPTDPAEQHTHLIPYELRDPPYEIGRGYDSAVIQNHTHKLFPNTEQGRRDYADVMWHHTHDLNEQSVTDGIEFSYEDNRPRVGAISAPALYALTGRSKYAGGWWSVRGWDDIGRINILNPVEYPGFLWRVPKHYVHKWYFRQWEFHFFALKSPVLHQLVWPNSDDPHTYHVSERETRYDGGIWNRKPNGCDVLTWSEAAQRWHRPDQEPDEADIQNYCEGSISSVKQ